MNLANEWNPAPKPTHKREKPTTKARGAISTKVRKELQNRSQGKCEREGCQREAVHAAHVTRRWKLQKTEVHNLLHLCLECHIWADSSKEGREWLKEMEHR